MIITCPNNVKLTKNSTEDGVDQFGISEVRITRNNNTFANGVHQPFFMQQRPRSTDIAIVVSQSSSELISRCNAIFWSFNDGSNDINRSMKDGVVGNERLFQPFSRR